VLTEEGVLQDERAVEACCVSLANDEATTFYRLITRATVDEKLRARVQRMQLAWLQQPTRDTVRGDLLGQDIVSNELESALVTPRPVAA
jgi:hypothetical protein